MDINLIEYLNKKEDELLKKLDTAEDGEEIAQIANQLNTVQEIKADALKGVK